MSFRAPRLAYVLLLVTWAAAIALASGSDLGRRDEQPAQPRLTAATNGAGLGNGPIAISDSREGLAILTASGMKPSSSVTGTVTIGNPGSNDVDVSLALSRLVDSGSATGKLSAVLNLVLQDTTSASPTTVYSGKLGAMPALALGTYDKRTSRTYRFTVSYPSSAGSVYQGTSTTVDYLWTATKSTGGVKK